VLGVPVLRRSGRAGRDGDLADAEPVSGGLPVFEDPHLNGPELDGLAAVRRDHGDLCHRSLPDES
jgi:hypothetical protein